MASKRLRACDLCGTREGARSEYTIGWRHGITSHLVLCSPCAVPLGPFLRLAVEKSGRARPIRPLTTGPIDLP